MKRVIAVSLTLLMGICAPAMADSAFSAFQGGINARAFAMGGAPVAVADDSTAIQRSPAKLTLLGDTRIGGGMSTPGPILAPPGTRRSPFRWDTHQYASAATTFAGFGLGFGWERLSFVMPVFLEIGRPGRPDRPDVFHPIPGDYFHFTYSKSVFIGTLAADLTGSGLVGVDIGVNIKYYTVGSSIAGRYIAATGFGFDIGLLISVGETLTIGVNAIDIGGTTLERDGVTITIADPLYTAGATLALLGGRLTMVADLCFTDAGLSDARIGVEVKVIPELALRGGVRGGVVQTCEIFPGHYFRRAHFTVGAGISTTGLHVDVAHRVYETFPGFTAAKRGNTRIGVEFKVIPELALRGGVVLTNAFREFRFTVGAGIAIAGLYVDVGYQFGSTLILSAEISFGTLLAVFAVEEETVG